MSKPAAGTPINASDAQGLSTSLSNAWAILETSGTTLADSKSGNTITLPGSNASIVSNSGNPYLNFSAATAGATMASAVTLPRNQSWSLHWHGGPTTDGVILFGHNLGEGGAYAFANAGNLKLHMDDNSDVLFSGLTNTGTENIWELTYTCTDPVGFGGGVGQIRLYCNNALVGGPSANVVSTFTFDRIGSGYSGTSLAMTGKFYEFYTYIGRALNTTDIANLNTNDLEIFTPSSTVTIARPTASQGIARNTTTHTGTIPISGAYSGGTPTNIEATINGGSTWTTIASGVSGGTYSGSLTSVPQGEYTLQVRWSSDHTVVSSTVSHIRIGKGVLVAGQSNATGNSASPNTLPNTSASGYGASGYVFDSWFEVNDANNSLASSGSLLPLVAGLMLADEDCPVFFVQVAYGGSGLIAGNQGWTKPTGDQYINMKAVFQNAAVPFANFEWGFWYQGETEVLDGTITESAYATAENTLINTNFAADVPGAPPFITVMLGDADGGTGAAVDRIRLAKIDGWNTGGKIKGGPGVADITNNLHIDNTQQLLVAKRIFAAYKSEVGGGTAGAGRGPQMTSVQYNTARTVVKVTFNKTLKTGATFTTSGFSVVGNGTPATISSISYDGTNAVDLNLSAAATLPITASMMSGNSTAGKTYPTGPDFTLPGSFGTINLPAEPFVGVTANPMVSFTVSETSLERGAAGQALHITLTAATSSATTDWTIAVGGSAGTVTAIPTTGATPILTVTAPTADGTATITHVPSGATQTITISDATAPAAPASVTLGTVASYNFALSWPAVAASPAGETITYDVKKNGSTVSSSQAGTTYAVASAVDGDVFAVDARDDSGNVSSLASGTFHAPTGSGAILSRAFTGMGA